ncbi:PAS domain S-box protein [Halorhabdus rudnickae]|uniref:PAS domain S-box protein n=1 Tax=Halorhabdus rudnickae TaxID=1775544 RepID=UPI00108249B1|nr:PAS domain S-box protein [Halorhabdus rudnickae]
MVSEDEVAREAFEKAATIMLILGVDGTVQRINDHGCAVLGYDRAELLGTDWFETVVPEESDVGLQAVLEDVKENDEADVHENVVRTADGEIRHVKWHVSGLRDDADKVTHLLVSGSDITDRIETECRLRRYEQAVESSTNLLAAVDREYRYVLTNHRYRDLYGIDEGVPADERLADVLGSERFEAIKPYVDRALAGESVEYETERTRPDGEQRSFHVRYFPLEDADGTIQGAVASLRDVTERRARERERRETMETFEGLFDGINDAVFVHRLDGQFLAVNETACQRLGYDEGELLGMTPWDLDVDEAVRKIDDRIETIREEGGVTFETVHVGKDGEQIPVEITSSLVTYFGETAILSVARDITDRKERERQLRREIDRLAEFADVISHDLRNPLNVAQGRLALLGEDCGSEHLEPIERALDRMEGIVEDTLTLARQGETVGETEPVRVADIVGQCWDAVATGTATLEITEEFTIRADHDRLRHVFENLFRNAVEHSSTSSDSQARQDAVEHGGETVTVRVGRCEAGFYVMDDGQGIDSEHRESVFEPGFSTLEHGTGFGLTIVRQIAEAHGWAVTVADAESGGARFEFADVEVIE